MEAVFDAILHAIRDGDLSVIGAIFLAVLFYVSPYILKALTNRYVVTPDEKEQVDIEKDKVDLAKEEALLTQLEKQWQFISEFTLRWEAERSEFKAKITQLEQQDRHQTELRSNLEVEYKARVAVLTADKRQMESKIRGLEKNQEDLLRRYNELEKRYATQVDELKDLLNTCEDGLVQSRLLVKKYDDLFELVYKRGMLKDVRTSDNARMVDSLIQRYTDRILDS